MARFKPAVQTKTQRSMPYLLIFYIIRPCLETREGPQRSLFDISGKGQRPSNFIILAISLMASRRILATILRKNKSLRSDIYKKYERLSSPG